MSAPRAAEIHKDVQNYYGNVLKTFADLQTNACVTPATLVPKYIRETLKNVHKDVTSRYYGCGLVVPERLENCQILDLGCGSGRDCYMLSQLVGKKGHVTGIDMTKAQVEVAKTYLEYHMKKFGFQAPNVTFIHGCIEKLAEAGAQQESYDIAVSNCVINLVPDKEQVLREVYDTLKYGGELYFSDVYANLEVPEDIKSHKVLWGECLGGALYWKDLAIIAQKKLDSALHVWSLPTSLQFKTRSWKVFLGTVALCLPRFDSSNSLRQDKLKDAKLFTKEGSQGMKKN